jgi:2-aminoadipate transaminase
MLTGMAQNDALPGFCTWLDDSNDVTTEMMRLAGKAGMISLAGGLPAPELYPMKAIESATKRALVRWGSRALEYGPITGFPALREAIATRMSEEIGQRIGTDNVLLTAGSMQALDGIGKILIEPGETIIAQHPTYMGALDAWRPRTPHYQQFTWDFEDKGFLAAADRAKFIYTVPNYSNPTGVLVGQQDRRALLALVREKRIWLVEDDPYSCMQLDGNSGPSILALDAADRNEDIYSGPVIYLGTLSKSLAPGFRVGWVVGNPEVIRALTLAKQCTDMTGSMFSQAVALELIEQKVESQMIDGLLSTYRERRNALCAALSTHLGDWFEWEIPLGGMFVWLKAKRADLDTTRLYRVAIEHNVMFCPGSAFDHAGKMHTTMRLNFTRSAPDVLEEGVRRLARAVEDSLSKLASGSSRLAVQ